jgi:hypothetical protein
VGAVGYESSSLRAHVARGPDPAMEWMVTVDVAQPDGAADAHLALPHAVRVEWYAPERPVNGTVFVRSDQPLAEPSSASLQR